MTIRFSDGLDPNGDISGNVKPSYVFGPNYEAAIITSVVVNVVVQAVIMGLYAKVYHPIWRTVRETATLRSEVALIVISLSMNAFFIARLVPTWVSLQSCSISHLVFMFALEAQLVLYTLLQIQRFAQTILSERHRKLLRGTVLFLGAGLAVVIMIFQQSYLEDSQCHFLNDYRPAFAMASFHFSLDALSACVFWFHIRDISDKTPSVRLTRLLWIVMGTLLLFGGWLMFISVANLKGDPQVLELAYNFHFTIILIVMIIPKQAQNMYGRIAMAVASASAHGKSLNNRISSVVQSRRLSNSSSLNRRSSSNASIIASDENARISMSRLDVGSVDAAEAALRVKMDLEGIDWRSRLKTGTIGRNANAAVLKQGAALSGDSMDSSHTNVPLFAGLAAPELMAPGI